jgi:hypothetical protein
MSAILLAMHEVLVTDFECTATLSCLSTRTGGV